MPGASVTITSGERQTTDSVVTNASGNFAKDRLLPGRYDVKAELTGFKARSFPGCVGVDTQTQLSLRLEPGDLTETVTVEAAEGQLLKTDRADVATMFERSRSPSCPSSTGTSPSSSSYTPGTQQRPGSTRPARTPRGRPRPW